MSKGTRINRDGDLLHLVSVAWRLGLGVFIGLVILACGLFINLQGARAETIQSNTNTNTNTNEQKQEQTQNNDQKVDIELKQNVSTAISKPAVEATAEATISANIAKSPETGVSTASMAAIFGALPFGLFMARFGKLKRVAFKGASMSGLGNVLVGLRTRGGRIA